MLQILHIDEQAHHPCSGTFPSKLKQCCYQGGFLEHVSVPLHEVASPKQQDHKHTVQHLCDPGIYAICTKNSSLVTRSITKRLLFVSLFSHILKACRAKCISITREPGKISRTNPYIKGTVPVKKEDNIVSVQLVYVLLCACLLI